jgi:hypothetical protein
MLVGKCSVSPSGEQKHVPGLALRCIWLDAILLIAGDAIGPSAVRVLQQHVVDQVGADQSGAGRDQNCTHHEPR